MKKKILNTLIIVVAIVSVIANFYPPLKYEPDNSDNIELAINIGKREFQPLFISKRRGITEMINGKFCAIDTANIMKIKKIVFNTTKLSGLFSHKITDVTPEFDSIEKTAKIFIRMSLFSGKEKYPFSLEDYSDEIQQAFCIEKDTAKKIITLAYFDLDKEIENIFKKIKKKENLNAMEINELRMFYLDKKKGSICNFNAIYE